MSSCNSAVVVSTMSRCSAVLLSTILCLLCAGATNTNTAITIIQRNLTVRDGQEAVFMCEVPCTHEAFWYVADLHNSFALPYTDTLSELTYSRSYSDCTSAGRYNDTLTLTATPELNNVPIQCSASMIDCNSGDDSCGFIVYSRFRILRVESDVPTPSPSPPSSPSPPPSEKEVSTACPSPSPVVGESPHMQ
ncbi:hypothetical protein GBAR_LOCUS18432 [Geodia barretti]|uniref:Uncharacterized protein n=1 Tax=Geodia barretti TaxID=519541 RepID=A0AA35WSX4_GEOBA|nr:hypothetical protein GBAR_LOCUS18432 [Geodia barretti]